MRTLAILVLTLFMLVLSQNTGLDAAYDRQNSTTTVISTTVSNAETQTVQETTPTPAQTYETTTVLATGEKNTSATPTASSQSPSPPTVTSESRSPTVTQLNKMSSSSPNKTIAAANTNSGSKIAIFVILLIILLVLLLVGFIHSLWTRRSTQDDSTPRLLLTMRETLRAGINNLGDRVGVVLWAGSKREDEDEEEVEERQGDVEEGGQETDNGGNSEGKDGRGEQSDSSDDYSSLEGKDQREAALSRREDEANQQSGDEGEVERSIPSDGRHSPARGQENGKKEGGLEEMALINSPTAEDENAELCHETIF